MRSVPLVIEEGMGGAVDRGVAGPYCMQCAQSKVFVLLGIPGQYLQHCTQVLEQRCFKSLTCTVVCFSTQTLGGTSVSCEKKNKSPL